MKFNNVQVNAENCEELTDASKNAPKKNMKFIIYKLLEDERTKE